MVGVGVAFGRSPPTRPARLSPIELLRSRGRKAHLHELQTVAQEAAATATTRYVYLSSFMKIDHIYSSLVCVSLVKNNVMI